MAHHSRPSKITLANGSKMPVIAYGTSTGTRMPDNENDVKNVETALEIGYRHFDTAKVYGTEKMLGDAVKNKIKQGLLKREDVYITTKLWPTDMNKGDVVPALKESLHKLSMDYVDLYLIHWPTSLKQGDQLLPLDENKRVDSNYFTETDYLDVWMEMENCYKQGLAQSIGVSNFNHNQLQRVLDNCTVKPTTNQIESNPYIANTKLIEFCQKNDIAVMVYSPLGGKGTYRYMKKESDADGPNVCDDPVITEIAERNKMTPAQVCLTYQIQRNVGAVVRSFNPGRMRDNLQVIDFKLSDEDMEKVSGCNKNYRQCVSFIGHKHYPFNEEF